MSDPDIAQMTTVFQNTNISKQLTIADYLQEAYSVFNIFQKYGAEGAEQKINLLYEKRDIFKFILGDQRLVATTIKTRICVEVLTPVYDYIINAVLKTPIDLSESYEKIQKILEIDYNKFCSYSRELEKLVDQRKKVVGIIKTSHNVPSRPGKADLEKLLTDLHNFSELNDVFKNTIRHRVLNPLYDYIMKNGIQLEEAVINNIRELDNDDTVEKNAFLDFLNKNEVSFVEERRGDQWYHRDNLKKLANDGRLIDLEQ